MINRFLIAVLILCTLLAGLLIWDMAAQAIPNLDLADYPVTQDRGVLSGKQLEIFQRILAAADSGVGTIECPDLTQDEQREIVTQLGLYYGSMEGVPGLVAWDGGTAALNLPLFGRFAAQKTVIDARIDEAAATLREGSDRYKLWQIANYLARRIEYTDGVRDTLDGLNGHGVCATYAMLFYKMATRLGIQTYICYGDADGEYHCWNMVVLDGERYYYDVTWYDNTVHDIRYLHSASGWGREAVLNRS